jgi:thiol:disulfide interchange protein DsbC
MKNRILAAALAVACTLAVAQAQTKAGGAVEDGIRARVEQRFSAKPDTVTRTPFGLWEVVIGTEIFYVDTEVNYAFVGRVIDAKSRDDLTSRRRDDLMRIDFKTLPLEQSFKIVRGDGSRRLVTFEDPNCGYCKKLYRDLAGMKNVTIHTFLYPILSQDSVDKARAIWCARDRVKAWDDWMMNGKAPPAPAADCKDPHQQVIELGRRLEVSGTPTIFFADGRRVPGAVPLERIEASLKEASGK